MKIKHKINKFRKYRTKMFDKISSINFPYSIAFTLYGQNYFFRRFSGHNLR